MRALVTGLVATCLVASSGEAAARSEWVVLRVERVEVAVARADGSPWDEDKPTNDSCGLFGGAADLLASKSWEPIVRSFCPLRGGSDPAAPDLFVRLADADEVEYVSPIVPDALAHDFGYEFLVPLEAITANTISISVHDNDGLIAMGELLGTVPVTRRDVDRLLASADRVRSYSDDSVTRIDLSALRYRKPAQTRVKLRARQRSTRAQVNVIAGESIEVRVSPPTAYATAVLGGSLHASAVDGCVRGIVQASGRAAVGIHDGGATVDRITTFTIRRRAPDMALWVSGLGGLSCRGRTSMIRITNVQSTLGSTLAPLAVRSIVRGRYLQGIKRCHERMIAGKRPANGKVTARFTVAPTGGVSRASVKGFDQTLDSCIESLIVKWRFGAPNGPNGKPTSEDFELDLRLDAI